MSAPSLRSLALRAFLVTALAGLASGCALGDRRDGPPSNVDPERSFHLVYEANLTDLEVGKKVDVWIPIPQDDPQQRISDLTWDGPLTGRRRTEPVHGNEMLHFSGTATTPTMQFVVEYHVDRYPYAVDLEAYSVDGTSREDHAKYLVESRLAFANAQVKLEAEALTRGKDSTLAQARAFYEHVLGNMSYDKNHQGWGRGSIEHACSVGKGNCTDFHTYFTSLCYAKGIASRFQIGIYGKYEVTDEEYVTGGYHCWAEFYVPGHGWVPVDISEADRDPRRVEKFFGSHTSNRVTLSTGRDLILAPPQKGAPLNFFLYPYAEQDGKPLSGDQVKKVTRWRDLAGS